MKISIGKLAKELGVSKDTLRRWESVGKISSERTLRGHRRYDLAKILGNPLKKIVSQKQTVVYARVSSHDQKTDLVRQVDLLSTFCAAHGWTFEIIQDLGSGLNYGKKGLKKLIQSICLGNIGRLVLTHKDRLLRFGAELIFSLCEQFGVEVILINKSDDNSFEDDLVNDVLEIITVFSARLYGARSRKNKKLLESLQEAAKSL
ncbi:MAG: IS607 family transposase [Chlamydiales bacterium]|nr:IS607 family transposase [Chlamydiales bacterium]